VAAELRLAAMADRGPHLLGGGRVGPVRPAVDPQTFTRVATAVALGPPAGAGTTRARRASGGELLGLLARVVGLSGPSSGRMGWGFGRAVRPPFPKP
jgi:hypothetical protein